MTTALNVAGELFGRLKAIRRVENNNHGQALWLCSCECGNDVEAVAGLLRAGSTKSCGCLRKENSISHGRLASEANTMHGHARKGKNTRTYRSWKAMKTRCTNNNVSYYKYYGGRGISVCDRWSSFENFLADMGERPKGKSLDRYPDNNGNYEPSNCRWATPKQQRDNRSVCVT